MAVTPFPLFAAFYAGASNQIAWLAVVAALARRGRAMSLATVANCTFNLIVSATFLNLIGAVGDAGTFLVCAIMILGTLAFITAGGTRNEKAQPGADRGRAESATHTLDRGKTDMTRIPALTLGHLQALTLPASAQPAGSSDNPSGLVMSPDRT